MRKNELCFDGFTEGIGVADTVNSYSSVFNIEPTYRMLKEKEVSSSGIFAMQLFRASGQFALAAVLKPYVLRDIEHERQEGLIRRQAEVSYRITCGVYIYYVSTAHPYIYICFRFVLDFHSFMLIYVYSMCI